MFTICCCQRMYGSPGEMKAPVQNLQCCLEGSYLLGRWCIRRMVLKICQHHWRTPTWNSVGHSKLLVALPATQIPQEHPRRRVTNSCLTNISEVCDASFAMSPQRTKIIVAICSRHGHLFGYSAIYISRNFSRSILLCSLGILVLVVGLNCWSGSWNGAIVMNNYKHHDFALGDQSLY